MRRFLISAMLIVFSAALSKSAFALAPILHFAQVTPDIYRGGRPTLPPADQVAWLKYIGVRTVIDLQGGDLSTPGWDWIIAAAEPGEKKINIQREQNHVVALGMDFINSPLSSVADVTGTEAHRIDDILELMNDPAAQPVFVHCEHGTDRTGLVVALYRVKYQNWDIETAHREMIAMGHNIWRQILNHEMDDYFYFKAREIVDHRNSSLSEVVAD